MDICINNNSKLSIALTFLKKEVNNMQKKIWRKPIIEDLIAKNTQANFSCEDYSDGSISPFSSTPAEVKVPRPGICCRCDGKPDNYQVECIYAGKGPGCSA